MMRTQRFLINSLINIGGWSVILPLASDTLNRKIGRPALSSRRVAKLLKINSQRLTSRNEISGASRWHDAADRPVCRVPTSVTRL